ncbi:MAG: DUF3488 domain-containing protein [Candidatus Hydrogenedens sp.]|nr:DUF3488 domain-containing protein [Candidatus Hydrogenedens sp.]
MRDGALFPLRICASLVLLSGYLALAAVHGYPGLLVALPLAAIALTPICERWDQNHRHYRTATMAITIVYACFLPFSFFLLGPLNGVVALVMFIQMHTQLHAKSEKAYHYIFLMTFFLVLAACVQSPDPQIALVLLLYMASLIGAMSSLRVWTETQAVAMAGQPTLLLRNGRRDDDGTSRPARWAFVLSVAAAGTGIFLFATVFFLFTPRIEAGFLGRDNTVVAFTGLSGESVSLNGGAYVTEDPTPIMQVEFPRVESGIFPEGQMYWRVATLPSYMDSSWSRRGLKQHYIPGVDPMFAESVSAALHRNALDSEIARDRSPLDYPVVEQRIFLSQMPPEGLPALDLPVKYTLEGNTTGKQILWEGKNDVTVRVQKSNSTSMDYTAWSEMVDIDEQLLRAAPNTYYDMDERDYALLTNHDLTPETVDLARQVTQDVDTLYEKARALEAFLSGPDFEYTLNLPVMPPDHAIDAFVLNIRQGHCEFYASALALMMRSLGIPSRVVSGYRGGEWSDSTHTYTVRGSMAHLWTEAYFSNAGWVRFDPAPAILMEPPGGVMGLLQRVNDAQLRMQMFWYREVISFDRGLQIKRLSALPQGIFRAFGFGQELPEEATGADSTGYFRWMLAGWFMLVVSIVMAIRRRRNRPAAFQLTPDQRRAVRLHRQLQQSLRRAGVAAEGLTAEEIRAAAMKLGWNQSGELVELLEQYNATRFGRRPLEQGTLRQMLTRLRAWRPGDA